jgi:hypothetical protein
MSILTGQLQVGRNTPKITSAQVQLAHRGKLSSKDFARLTGKTRNAWVAIFEEYLSDPAVMRWLQSGGNLQSEIGYELSKEGFSLHKITKENGQTRILDTFQVHSNDDIQSNNRLHKLQEITDRLFYTALNSGVGEHGLGPNVDIQKDISTVPLWRSHMNVFSDVMGMTKQTTQYMFGTTASVIRMNVLSGCSSLISGQTLLKSGKQLLEEADVDDNESKHEGRLNIALGSSLLGLGIEMASSNLAQIAGSAATGAAIGTASMALLPLLSASSAGYGLFSYAISSKFRASLLAQMNRAETDLEGAKNILSFIRNYLSISDQEINQITRKYSHIEQGDLQKKLIAKDLEKLKLRKQKMLKRRIGKETFNEIFHDRNIDQLGSPFFDPAKAKILANKILKGNLHQMSKSMVTLLISILYTVASILLIGFGGPAGLAIIFMITSFLWLTIDSNRINERLYRDLSWYLTDKKFST